MSLLDEAVAEQRHNGEVCSLTHHLPDPELEEAIAAVRAGKLHATALERALAKRDVKIKAGILRRHARGDCACDVTT